MALQEYKMTILEYHLDSFGHVNNATYLEILEEARWQVITENGYGYKECHKNKKGPVILEVNLKFQNELRLREQITITTEMVDYKGKVGHILQKIVKADGKIGAEALFTFGFFDMELRKLIDPTPEWRKALRLD